MIASAMTLPGSRPPLSYTTAAQVLLGLAVSPERIIHSGAKDDPIRHVFREAAEACERVDQARADREAALLYAAELQSLLGQAVDILDAQPLPLEGGTWDSYMLGHRARRALKQEPLTAGHALRGELHATRVVARAATALVAARQEGSPARVRVCEEAVQQAVAALKAAPNRAPIGPASV
jgi:hypothetical protein